MTDISHLLGKIHQGDCLPFMRELPNDCIDVIITSPPYNKLGNRGRETGGALWSTGGRIKYNSFDDNMDESSYRAWQIDLINEAIRILKPGGSLFYNHKNRRVDGRISSPLEWIIQTKAIQYQHIIWNRQSSMDLNNLYLTPTTEYIYWLVKGSPKVYKSACKHITEIWAIPPQPDKEHPAPFPKSIVLNCINLTTEQDDIVFDPFMGSGTTAICADAMGRKWLGTELDPGYCAIAQARIDAERSQLKLFS